MPEDGLETLKSFDAIFFGSVGAPDVLTILPYGGYVCLSVRALINMRMCAQPVFTGYYRAIAKRAWRSGLGDCA